MSWPESTFAMFIQIPKMHNQTQTADITVLYKFFNELESLYMYNKMTKDKKYN